MLSERSGSPRSPRSSGELPSLTQSRNVAVKFGEFAVGNLVSLLCLGVFRLDSGYNVDEPSVPIRSRVNLIKRFSRVLWVLMVFSCLKYSRSSIPSASTAGKFLSHAGSPPLYAVGTAVTHLCSLPQVWTVDYVGHGTFT